MFYKNQSKIFNGKKIISKKCNFFSFYDNYILWRKQEKIYACDCILENRKNLIQSCLDEIGYYYCIVLDYAFLKNVDLNIKYDCAIKISITGTIFLCSNFLNSNINFIMKGNCIFHFINFFETKVVFNCNIMKEKERLLFLFPEIKYSQLDNSILIFIISTTDLTHFSDTVVNFFEKFLKNIQTIAKDKTKDKTKFIFYFKFGLQEEIYSKLKEIETKHNNDTNNYIKYYF